MGETQVTLPGLSDDSEAICLRDACRLLGIRKSSERLAEFGLQPIACYKGRVLYRLDDCEALRAKREAEKARRNAAIGAGKPTVPDALFPSPDQAFAVLCECRNLLRQLTQQKAI